MEVGYRKKKVITSSVDIMSTIASYPSFAKAYIVVQTPVNFSGASVILSSSSGLGSTPTVVAGSGLDVIYEISSENLQPYPGEAISLHGVNNTIINTLPISKALVSAEPNVDPGSAKYTPIPLIPQSQVAPEQLILAAQVEPLRPEQGTYISLHGTVLTLVNYLNPIKIIRAEPKTHDGFVFSSPHSLYNNPPTATQVVAASNEPPRPEPGKVISAFALWQITNVLTPPGVLATSQALYLELHRPWAYATAAVPSQIPQTLPGVSRLPSQIEELTKLEPKQPTIRPPTPKSLVGGGDGGDVLRKYRRPRKEVIAKKKRMQEEYDLISLMIHAGLFD